MIKDTLYHLKTIPLFSPIISLIKEAPFAKPYDKRKESEKQMLQRVSIKFAILLFAIVLFDSILDVFLGLLDIALQLTHLIIEAIEYSLESLLALTLQTSPHQSETILVNGMIMITLFFIYRAFTEVPQWYYRLKRNFQAVCLRHVRREFSCWRAMSVSHKIKWLSAYSLGILSLWFVIT